MNVTRLQPHQSLTEPTPPMISLAEAMDVNACGHKAYHLAQMIRSGLNVPTGLVITTAAFDRHLYEQKPPIDEICQSLRLEQPTTFQTAAQRITQLVTRVKLSNAVTTGLSQLLQSADSGETWAVRSSAVGEDSAEHSFAGQMDSFLNLKTQSEIEQAILKTWASYWSARSLAYQLARQVELSGMSVIVQRCVAARRSGVMFTRHPDGAVADEIIVELVEGQGEQLVAGQVDPLRLVVSRKTGQFRVVSYGQSETVRESRSERLEQLIEQLVAAAESLEKLFGQPQDVEWAEDTDGRLHLLQSRPITQPAAVAGKTAAAQGAQPRRRMIRWSNANVNENYPEPLTPLLYSIALEGYYHYFRNLGMAVGIGKKRIAELEHELQNIIGVHGGRMYYNLSNIETALRSAPFPEAVCRAFETFVGAASAGSDKSDTERPGRLRSGLRTIRIVMNGVRLFRQLDARVTEFESEVDRFAVSAHPNALGTLSTADLRQLFNQFMEIRCHRWLGGSLADAATVVCYGMLQRLLSWVYPENELSAIQNSLLQGLPDLVSSQPVSELWELADAIATQPALQRVFQAGDAVCVWQQIQSDPQFAAFRSRFEEYLERWGFRRSGELLLTVPSYQEQPEELIAMLQSYTHAQRNAPRGRLEQQQQARHAATSEVLQRMRTRPVFRWLPWPRTSSVARLVIRATQRAIGMRERARLKQSLLYSRLRRVLLELGDRLVHEGRIGVREDILFLDWKEIQRLLSGGEMFPDNVRELIQLRRASRHRWTAVNCPDELELPEGEYWKPPGATSAEVPHSPEAVGDKVLMGSCACGGTAAGRAAVLDGIEEFDKLKHGDILVARQTDPGWGPLFHLIDGLILERGGMLSHGAILAREFGIPTIVGVASATTRLGHGQPIRLDADRGEIHVDAPRTAAVDAVEPHDRHPLSGAES